MLELSGLGRFVAASQDVSLTKAAKALGLAPSTLSAQIQALEGELGFALFDRTPRGLAPNGSAHWLFRESLNILHAEAFVRRIVQQAGPDPLPVAIEIKMAFTIGRLAKAVAAAMEAAAVLVPGACFTVRWREQRRSGRATDGATAHLRYHAGPGGLPGTLITSDPLTLVSGQFLPDAPEGPVIVPRIPGVTPRWLKAKLRARCPALELSFTDDDLASLEALVGARPEIAVLVPANVLSTRLRAFGLAVRPLDPGLALPIVAAIHRRNPAATAFVHCLRNALAAPEEPFVASPAITTRQLDYFDALRRTLSVTGAAKRANVAQPAVTDQLARLEATLQRPLFARSRTGLTLTGAGHRFDKAVTLLNAARHEIAVKRPGIGGPESGLLQLGILPAAGAGGFLISRVARAVALWRRVYPGLQLRILEQPNVALQARIRRGTLDLGIITTRSPRMARFDLGSSEALALVVNPGLALHPPGVPVDFEALTQIPLVLPTAQFGLRQLIDDAGRSRGLTLRPVIEVDSLSMCVALARESRLGTILPPSDVMAQAAAGELSVHVIQTPRVVRTLQIIYSADRRLTEAERELVRLLRAALSATEVQ